MTKRRRIVHFGVLPVVFLMRKSKFDGVYELTFCFFRHVVGGGGDDEKRESSSCNEYSRSLFWELIA